MGHCVALFPPRCAPASRPDRDGSRRSRPAYPSPRWLPGLGVRFGCCGARHARQFSPSCIPCPQEVALADAPRGVSEAAASREQAWLLRVDHCSGEGSGLGAPRACCGGRGSPQVVPHAYCVVEGSLGSARRRGRRAARRAAQSLVVSVSCVGRSEAPHVETLRGACRSPPTTRTGQTHTVVR